MVAIRIRIGTRKSAMALAQTEEIAHRLRAVIPDIEVEIVNNPSVGSIGGAGEGPNGFVPAAIANAVFDATGKQPRRLPLTPKYIRTLLSS